MFGEFLVVCVYWCVLCNFMQKPTNKKKKVFNYLLIFKFCNIWEKIKY